MRPIHASFLTLAVLLACREEAASADQPKAKAAPPAPPQVETPPPAEAPFSPEAAEPYFTKGPTEAAAAAFAVQSWQAARDGFTAALGGTTDEVMRARLNLLLGLADAGLGRWREAADELDAAAPQLPLLADHVAYHTARAAFGAADYPRATERAKRVKEGSVPHADALMLLADIARAQQKWSDEREVLETYLARFPNGERRSEARYRLAECEERRKAPADRIMGLYREVLLDAPVEPWGELAKKRFTGKLTAADHVRRGKVYFDNMRNPESEADFAAALTAPGLDPALECEAKFHRAQSVFKQRQRARSAPFFDEAIEACARARNVDKLVRAAYQGARGFSNLETEESERQAIARFERAETEGKEHSFADDARLRQAEVWLELEEMGVAGAGDRAVDLLRTLPEVHKTGDMRAEALWRLAWRAWTKKNYKEVVVWLDKQIEVVPLETNYWAEGQPQYWKARAFEKLKRSKDALASYRECVEKYPLSYYSLLALNRLREHHKPELKRLLKSLAAPPADKKKGAAPAPEFVFAPSPTYGEPGFARGVELLRLGLGAEAERELMRVGMTVPGGKQGVTDPARVERLWATALLFDRAGRYDKSHWIARWAVTDYKRAWPTAFRRARWDIAYPRAWWHVLEPAAKAQGYPPELLISFVREESAFDPIRESFANAIGLTQMIIPTATRFGRELGFTINRENLRDPVKNVAIGSRWLAFLMKLYGGRVGLAVPAYNSGEGAMARWLCERGRWEQDEFAEAIPFDETRNYAKRVLSSFFTYTYLSKGEVPVIENKIPASVRPKKCR